MSDQLSTQQVKEVLIRTYASDTGLPFEEALALACKRDDQAADILRLQAQAAGVKPRS